MFYTQTYLEIIATYEHFTSSIYIASALRESQLFFSNKKEKTSIIVHKSDFLLDCCISSSSSS
jgi:hypothetical protein